MLSLASQRSTIPTIERYGAGYVAALILINPPCRILLERPAPTTQSCVLAAFVGFRKMQWLAVALSVIATVTLFVSGAVHVTASRAGQSAGSP